MTICTNQTTPKKIISRRNASRADIINRSEPLPRPLLISSLCSPECRTAPASSTQLKPGCCPRQRRGRRGKALVGRPGIAAPSSLKTHSPTNRRTNKQTNKRTNNLLARRCSTDTWSSGILRSGAPLTLWLRRVLQMENQAQAQNRPC
uniref:Uncharacterized protein n=1 Tax=Physcomitrium patens TaxID=3218 RepID=A0A2K1JR08_PHYPA|nr:hypothetical protein PHYPA_016259 [Physcomitrium patens]